MNWGYFQTQKGLWLDKWTDFLDKIDWQAILHNPYFIGLGALLLALALYKRKYEFLAFVFCTGAFYCVCRQIASENGTAINPRNIITFVTLSVAAVGVSIYFLFLRDD